MNFETVKKGLGTILSSLLALLADGLSLTWPWTTVEVRTEFSLWVLDNVSSLDCLLSNSKGSVAMAAWCPSPTEYPPPLGVLEGHSWAPTHVFLLALLSGGMDH